MFCAGIIFFSSLYAVTRFTGVSLCVVYNLFGVECIGCGLSRGMMAALHGDIGAAVAHHILAVPLLAGILVYFVLLGVDICRDSAYARRMERLLGNRWMFLLYGALMVVAAIQKWM